MSVGRRCGYRWDREDRRKHERQNNKRSSDEIHFTHLRRERLVAARVAEGATGHAARGCWPELRATIPGRTTI